MRLLPRKFRLLVRHFASGLVSNDLLSAGEDLHATYAGGIAAGLVVSATLALMFLGKYDSVVLSQNGAFKPAPALTLAEKTLMALDDKTLLLGGVMLVMGLLTTLFWDALAVDERDGTVLGPLPVPPRLVLGAKLTAACGAACVAALALNLIPALLFPVVVLLKTPVDAGTIARWSAGHLAAGLAGCAWIFLTLAALRGGVALCLSARLARRVLSTIQFLLVLGLLTLLLALPLLVAGVRPALASRPAWLWVSPPFWCLGIEEVLAGSPRDVFGGLARAGLLALGLAGASAALVQMLAWRLRWHRFGSPATSRQSRVGLLPAALAWVARRVAEDPRARASFLFTARTLLRSPRHRLYIGGSLGAGLAIAGATAGAAYSGVALGRTPWSVATMGLAAQLNLLFFLVVGFRLAATVPADLDAGWVFRFHAAATRERQLAGSRAAVFVLGVLPLLVALAPLHAWAWGAYAALVHFAFGVVTALLLLEIAFLGYERVPFVSAYTPGRVFLSLRFAWAVLGYLAFAYVTPQIERLLIDRPGMFYAWVASFVLATARLVASQSSRLRRDRMPVFDVDASEVQELRLTGGMAPRAERGAAPPVDPRGSMAAAGPVFGAFGGGDETPAPPGLSRRIAIGLRAAPRALTQLDRDVLFAIRRLAASPGVTLFSILTLALGIGATTAIYSVIRSTVLQPLQVPHLEQLVNIYHIDPAEHPNRPMFAISQPDYDDFRAAQTVFSEVAAHYGLHQVAVADGTAQGGLGEIVSGNYFSTLRVAPALGRLLQPADDRPGAPPVVVIGHRLWQGMFGGRPDIIGRCLALAGTSFEIVGVAPPEFKGVELPNLLPTTTWVTLAQVGLVDRERDYDREDRWLLLVGRLEPGRTFGDARNAVWEFARDLDRAAPLGRDLPWQLRAPYSVGRYWRAVPAGDRLLTERADPLMRRLVGLTMGAVGLVLMVACTNLANLMLARGAARRREFAVRRALGASRWQVIREQLVESTIVAALGSVAALAAARALMAYGLTRSIRLGPRISLDLAPSLSLPVALVGCGATMVSLLVFGLIPALRLTTSELRTISGGGDGDTSSPPWRGRRLLIGAQVAVSVALVVMAGLAVRQLNATANEQVGRDIRRLATIRFDFRAQKWPEARARQALDQLAGALSHDPAVESVAVSTGLTAGAGNQGYEGFATSDRPFDAPRYYGVGIHTLIGSPSLFPTLGVRLVAGRLFDERDSTSSTPVVVLSRRAAASLFGARAPLGREVLRQKRVEGPTPGIETEALTVIGVVDDTDTAESLLHPRGMAYRPFGQQYEPWVLLVARASTTAERTLSALTGTARRLQPDLGVVDSGAGLSLAGLENTAFQVMGFVAGSLGLLALTLAMAGLYGVLSYLVAHRTREIGIRRVLGAGRRELMALVLFDGLRPVVWGLVAGFAAGDLVGLALQPAFRSPLPQIDPVLLVLVPVPFLAAAIAACYLPARRAAGVEPGEALRQV